MNDIFNACPTKITSLINNGVDVNIRSKDNNTLLIISCLNSDNEIIKFLLAKGSNVEACNNDGITPLYNAAKMNNLAVVVKLLFQYNVNPNTKTKENMTPLHIAASNGNFEIVLLLLTKGADPNTSNINGYTPLHDACLNNKLDIVNLLLKNNATPNTTNRWGWTPLHEAVGHRYIKIVEELLLCADINIDVKNCHNKTPFDLAIDKEIKEMLEDYAFICKINKELIF